MITNLLAPTPMLEIPLGEACYSEAVVLTAARLIAEMVARKAGRDPRGVTQPDIDEVVAGLHPWQPISKEGRFPKRLVAWAHKQHKVTLPDKFVSTLGNYLALDLPYGPLHVQIRKEFNWKQGDFGDAGSCFFNDGTFDYLTHSAAHALLFYTAKGKGEGRAIVVPSPVGEALIINAYGPSLDQVRSRLRVLTPDRETHLVRVHNRRKGVYINLDSGLLVGAEPPQDSVMLDFLLPRLIRDPRGGMGLVPATLPIACPHCHAVREIADMRAIGIRQVICTHCFNMSARQSAHSGRWYMIEDMAEVTDVRGRVVVVGKDELNEIRKCQLCTRPMVGQRGYYASVEGVRHESVCQECADKRLLHDSCRYCGCIKHAKQTCYCQKGREDDARRTVPGWTYASASSTAFSSNTVAADTTGTDTTRIDNGRWGNSPRSHIIRAALEGIRDGYLVPVNEWNLIVEDANLSHPLSDGEFISQVRRTAHRLYLQAANRGGGADGEAGEPVDAPHDAGGDGLVREVRDEGNEQQPAEAEQG